MACGVCKPYFGASASARRGRLALPFAVACHGQREAAVLAASDAAFRGGNGHG